MHIWMYLIYSIAHPEPSILPGIAILVLSSAVDAVQVDTIITIFQGWKSRSEEIKILHKLVAKLQLESNESLLGLKVKRNEKKAEYHGYKAMR